MGIVDFIGEIAEGLGSWLPTLAQALVDTFMTLFFTTGEGTATLNTLGSVSVTFVVIGISFRCLPAVLGWLRARWTTKKKSKKAKAA